MPSSVFVTLLLLKGVKSRQIKALIPCIGIGYLLRGSFENQFTQKKQIAMNSNIPKIVSRIAATSLLLAISFFVLPSFWFWVLFETIAVSLVAIGCGGEWYLHHNPAGRETRAKDDHHKLESRFIGAVALGVTMEIFGLGHSIREGVDANERISTNELAVAGLTSNRLELEARVLKLKAQQGHRTIKREQAEGFITLWENPSPLPLRIVIGTTDNETENFAIEFVNMLYDARLITNKDIVRIPGMLAGPTHVYKIGESEIFYGDPDNPCQVMAIYGSEIAKHMQWLIGEEPKQYRISQTNLAFTINIMARVLNKSGVPTRLSPSSGIGPEEIGFFIPQKLY